jgi:hypothetical protein
MRLETIWKTELYIHGSLGGMEIKSLDREFLQQKVDELASLMKNETIAVGE